MKNLLFGWKLVLIILFIVQISIGCRQHANEPAASKTHRYINDGIDSLTSWIDSKFLPVVQNSSDTTLLRQQFFKGRELYKRIEFAIEFFFPNAARNINGPPLPEIEPEEHIVLDPGGFQVIEEHLFPFNAHKRNGLIVETRKLKSIITRVKALWDGTQIRDDQLIDALKFECYRVICLGVTGFDTPLSLNGIREVPAALGSVKNILSFYGEQSHAGIVREIDEKINNAILYAKKNGDFVNFNRMEFIRTFINPVTSGIFVLQKELSTPVVAGNYALRSDIKTIFDSAAFNINYFTPDANSFATKENIELGSRLFRDPILSETNKISCASCHDPKKAFTDGLVKSRALGSNGFLSRNTPSIINAGMQKAQFFDMRATFLEDQVRNVVESKDEIHGSLQNSVKRLSKDTMYLKAFKVAFPAVKTGINERLIQVALACYIRSVTSFQSSFDQHLRGNQVKMTEEEVQGFNLFMGKAKCGTCHFMPLFNGTVPPTFISTESEVIGIPETVNGKELSKDPGRFAIYQIPNFKHSFKTPSIRNVALTGPYMHNGVFSTLGEVVEFYNNGGGRGIGLEVENQTLPEDSLMLTSSEKKALIAFMHTLTDSSFVANGQNK